MENQRITNVLLSLVVLLLLALVGTQMAWWGPNAVVVDDGDSVIKDTTVYYSSASLCRQWEVKGQQSDVVKAIMEGTKTTTPAGWEPFGDAMVRRCVK